MTVEDHTNVFTQYTYTFVYVHAYLIVYSLASRVPQVEMAKYQMLPIYQISETYFIDIAWYRQ